MKRPLIAVDIGNSTIGIALYPEAANGKKFFTIKIDSSSVKSHLFSKSIFSALQELFSQNGKHKSRHPRGGGGPFKASKTWIPAFAGMTRKGPSSCEINSGYQPEIGVVISSVVPKMNRIVISAIKKFCKDKALRITETVIVDFTNSGGLSFGVRNPETVGSDRIADAVAALQLAGKPVAVADLGTATTISVVGGNGNFIGGAIMPGINMMMESLAARTAKLPSVPISKLRNVTGRDTKSAIASGIINGTAGAIEKIIKGIERETDTKFHLILTGGRAAMVSPYLGKNIS